MSMRNESTTADQVGRRTAATVTLSLLGAAFASAVVVPGLHDWAAAFMLAAVTMLVAAFGLAFRASRTRPRHQSGTR
jgi:hypothetical protein